MTNKMRKNGGEIITTNFIEGDKLPFSNLTSDTLYNLMPHQSCLEKPNHSIGVPSSLIKASNVDCICIKKHSILPSFDSIVVDSIKRRRALIWVDPSLVPTECLACIICLWLEKVRPSDNVGLGIIIPDCEVINPVGKDLKAWVPSSSGPLIKDATSLKIPVWYPSLRRNHKLLEKISDTFKPIEIFPIVDFPRIIGYAAEKEIAIHHQMLDRYRTRTRNFIYLNSGSPEEGLDMLSKSLEAVSRDGKMPRSLLLTPGGTSISYLVSLIAGVLSDATFIIPDHEIPFHKSDRKLGFALMKKSE